jgi:glycosyltransferase involved in cell wall biosynthesis
MPKLLNINTYHYRRGGSDVVYLEHGALFEKAGWDTAYFAMHHPKNESTPWSRYFVDEIELGHSYSIARKISIAKQIIRSSVHGKAINRLLDDFPADIAHVHNIRHHIAPNILGELKRRGASVVLTVHDLKMCCPAYRMLDGQNQLCEACKPNKVYNCTLKRCMHGSLPLSTLISIESAIHRIDGSYSKNVDRLICPSKFYLEKHVEWGWPREQLVYIPNDFAVPSSEVVPAPGEYLCYFGRLSFEKGVKTVIRACAAAGMPLQLVGEGPEEGALRSLAAETGADVTFHGRQSGEDLFSIVRGARACVLASEWYENAPKSVLEAFGLGKVVIGADIGGISEMIMPGETGWLFPSGNVAAIEEVLRNVLATPDSRLVEMGGKAMSFARAEFSTELYLKRMINLYEELGVSAYRTVCPLGRGATSPVDAAMQ